MIFRKYDIIYIKGNNKYEKNIQGLNRPFVVISNDIGNFYSNILLVCPLTTRHKKEYLPTHVDIRYNNSVVLCEQIFTINQSNCLYITSIVKAEEKNKINDALKASLDLY